MKITREELELIISWGDHLMDIGDGLEQAEAELLDKLRKHIEEDWEISLNDTPPEAHSRPYLTTYGQNGEFYDH